VRSEILRRIELGPAAAGGHGGGAGFAGEEAMAIGVVQV
jgi:hypothetical protein